MTINNLMYVVVTLAQALRENPGRFVPYVALACAVTLVIAVTTDAWLRSRQTAAKKTVPVRSGSTLR